MASTNWDIDRKRRRPPAWDPPKLLLVVVSGLHVVVGTSSVVGSSSTVASGSWAPASGCDNQVYKGGKGEQSNREYSSKVLASKDLHNICIGINEMGSICGLNCRMPE